MSDKKQIMIEINDSQLKVGMTKGINPMEALMHLNDASNTIMEGLIADAKKISEQIKNRIIPPNMAEVIKANKKII